MDNMIFHPLEEYEKNLKQTQRESFRLVGDS